MIGCVTSLKIFWRCYRSKDLRIFGVKSFILFAAACSLSLSLALRHSFDFFSMFAWNVFFVRPLSLSSRLWAETHDTEQHVSAPWINTQTDIFYSLFTRCASFSSQQPVRMHERTNERKTFSILYYNLWSHLICTWGKKATTLFRYDVLFG